MCTCRMGLQLRADELMNTIPTLDTVAGEALSILCTSNTSLQQGDMVIRSPLARVRVLLSSRTEFKFSIQMASTGPSRTIQMFSPGIGNRSNHFLRTVDWYRSKWLLSYVEYMTYLSPFWQKKNISPCWQNNFVYNIHIKSSVQQYFEWKWFFHFLLLLFKIYVCYQLGKIFTNYLQ